MSVPLPIANQRIIDTPQGQAIGSSYRWPGGQYCAIHTGRGVIGCGIYDVACADEFNLAVAIAKGTPQKPLCEPEDLFAAKIVKVTAAAAKLGIAPGMTGQEALVKMLSD